MKVLVIDGDERITEALTYTGIEVLTHQRNHAMKTSVFALHRIIATTIALLAHRTSKQPKTQRTKQSNPAIENAAGAKRARKAYKRARDAERCKHGQHVAHEAILRRNAYDECVLDVDKVYWLGQQAYHHELLAHTYGHEAARKVHNHEHGQGPKKGRYPNKVKLGLQGEVFA